MAATFKFGNGNWAVKEDYALAYNDQNGNFKPLPFDFTRASSATRVNKNGLIETVPSGKPRIDFLNNTSGHLLLEPSRTNLYPYSNQSSAPALNTFSAGTSTISITNDYGISPDGTQNAMRFQATCGSTLTDRAGLRDLLSMSATDATLSFYGKSNTGSNQTIAFHFKGGTQTVVTLTNEWQRFTYTDTSNTSNYAGVEIRGTYTDTDVDVLLFGFQMEQASYATSYIPTSGATVTRSADDVDTDYGSKNTLSDEVSVYFNLLPQVSTASNTNKCLSFGFNSSSNANSYSVLRFNGTNWSSRIQGTTGNNFNDLGVSQTTEIKAVMVLTQSGYSIYANGSTAVASGSYGGTAPTINSVAFVEILNDTDDRGVYKIKELKVYNTALTEAEAQALTS